MIEPTQAQIVLEKARQDVFNNVIGVDFNPDIPDQIHVAFPVSYLKKLGVYPVKVGGKK